MVMASLRAVEGTGDWRTPWQSRTAPAPSLIARAVGGVVLPLYTACIFAGAFLLFLVQPMFARMVLPRLGGSPSVWNTAMVFYQGVLLAGYGYAHATTARLGVRRQAMLHLALLALPLLTLPVQIPGGWAPPAAQNPIPWLLAVLVVAVGSHS